MAREFDFWARDLHTFHRNLFNTYLIKGDWKGGCQGWLTERLKRSYSCNVSCKPGGMVFKN